MSGLVTLGEMVGLVVDSPEPGSVNFRMMQALLRAMIEKLQLTEFKTNFDQKSIFELQKSPPSSLHFVQALSLPTKYEPNGKRMGGADGVGPEFPAPTIPIQRRYSLNYADEDAMVRNRRFTTGEIRVDERARPTMLRRLHPPSFTAAPSSQTLVNMKELESRMNQLEGSWNRMSELVVVKAELKQTADSPDGRDIQERVNHIPVHELWTYVTMEKKVQANTDGITKLMSLTEDVIHRLQQLKESNNEERAELEKKIDAVQSSCASRSELESHQTQLNMLSGTLQQLLPSVNTMQQNFVTWTSLDSTLRGEVPSSANLEIDSESPKSSGAALAAAAAAAAAAARGKRFSQPHAIHRPASSTRDEKREGLKKDAQSKDVGLVKQGPGAAETRTTAGVATETAVDKTANTLSNVSVISSASEFLIAESENPDLSAVGLTQDLLIKLQHLGKHDERFDRIENALKNLEGRVGEKTASNLEPSSDFKSLAKKVDAVSRELDRIGVAMIQITELHDQLSNSQMPHLPVSLSILSKASDTRIKGQQSAGAELGAKVKPSRSMALDAIEKSMKTVDDTFAVLMGNIKDLQEKFKQQMESLESRFDRWRAASIEDKRSKPEEISNAKSLEELSANREIVMSEIKAATSGGVASEVEGKSDDGLGAKVEWLEKTMNEKTDEIRKLKRYLRLLVTDADKQTKDVAVNMDQLIDRMREEMMTLSSDNTPRDSLYAVVDIRNQFNSMLIEIDKLKYFAAQMNDTSDKQQVNLQDTQEATEQLQKQTDDVTRELISMKMALDEKVDTYKLDAVLDEFAKGVITSRQIVSLLDAELKTSVKTMISDINNNTAKEEEISLLVDNMDANVHHLSEKMLHMQKQLDKVRILSDDAAVVRRQLFSCLSCDRPVVLATSDPKPSLACQEGFFAKRTTKPFTSYELDQLRKNGKRLPKSQRLSNYERALLENDLTRSGIRDLRSDCAIYWRQPKPIIPSVQRHKSKSEVSFPDDLRYSQLNSGNRNREQSSGGTSSTGEARGRVRSVVRSESTEANQGSLQSVFNKNVSASSAMKGGSSKRGLQYSRQRLDARDSSRNSSRVSVQSEKESTYGKAASLSEDLSSYEDLAAFARLISDKEMGTQMELLKLPPLVERKNLIQEDVDLDTLENSLNPETFDRLAKHNGTDRAADTDVQRDKGVFDSTVMTTELDIPDLEDNLRPSEIVIEDQKATEDSYQDPPPNPSDDPGSGYEEDLQLLINTEGSSNLQNIEEVLEEMDDNEDDQKDEE